MQGAVTTPAVIRNNRPSSLALRILAEVPTLVELAGAVLTALLLAVSFPNLELFFFAWVGLIPLLFTIARKPSVIRAFILGWVSGFLFFYVTCYWLTYSMIHYGRLSPVLSYVLLTAPALASGFFPALFASLLAVCIKRLGNIAVLLAPFAWVAFEWTRLGVTGQLWNALGYSQAYQPLLIQTATLGGIYAVSFSLLAINAAITLLLLKRTRQTVIAATSVLIVVGLSVLITSFNSLPEHAEDSATSGEPGYLNVVAVQPNVPMTPVKSDEENEELINRHLIISSNGLREFGNSNTPRLVIWPESPMSFTYGSDPKLQSLIGTFARDNKTSVLLNSLEAAPHDGGYNSALLINEEGRLISQYDKIRLLPFGEYVPVPQWLGGSLISAIVGDFAAGDKYTLMPVGGHKLGVFICIESAYPSIARTFTSEGADVLINMSNDGYLGPTAVMRQHLANAVFRAVENGRPLLSVTNTGITAFITAGGQVQGATPGFVSAGRIWTLTDRDNRQTFYSKHGDVFAIACALITLAVFLFSLRSLRRDRIRN